MRLRRIAATAVAGAAACALLAPPALAVMPAKGTYKGQSEQKDAPYNDVQLRVDRHHRVVRFAIDWSAKCQKPGKFWDAGTEVKNPKNEPLGTFHDHGTYTSKTEDGFKGKITLTVDGRFTDKTHAKGEWKAKVKVFNKNGKRVDTCSVKTGWRVGPN